MSDNILWDYVDEEGDALLLEMRDRMEHDGFVAETDGDVEMLSMMVLASASMKTLAIMCERVESDLAEKFLEMNKNQVELLKFYLVKKYRQERAR